MVESNRSHKPSSSSPSTGQFRPEAKSPVHEVTQQVTENAKAAVADTAKGIERAYANSTRGATEWNVHLIEIARANTNAAFDLAHQLACVKSPSEFLELSATHARKQFETFTEQTRELSAIAQRVATETVGPLQYGFSKTFDKSA